MQNQPAPPQASEPRSSSLNRRQFLRRVSLAGAALAAPTLIPGSALGLNGAVPPSERIVMAGVGIGGRGTGVLKWMLPEKDVQFVAVCDAKRSSREAVKRVIDDHYGTKNCQTYADLRVFLAQRASIARATAAPNAAPVLIVAVGWRQATTDADGRFGAPTGAPAGRGTVPLVPSTKADLVTADDR